MDEEMDFLSRRNDEDILEINSFIESILRTIISRPEARNLVNSWIKGTYGKIIAWKIRTKEWEENYHLILTPEHVRFHDWEYPAFDVIMIGKPEMIHDLILGKIKVTQALGERKVMVWGNLNEAITFQKVIAEIKKL